MKTWQTNEGKRIKRNGKWQMANGKWQTKSLAKKQTAVLLQYRFWSLACLLSNPAGN